jgi:hypothetical protein
MPAEQEAISKTQGRHRELHNSRGTWGGVWAADIREGLPFEVRSIEPVRFWIFEWMAPFVPKAPWRACANLDRPGCHIPPVRRVFP